MKPIGKGSGEQDNQKRDRQIKQELEKRDGSQGIGGRGVNAVGDPENGCKGKRPAAIPPKPVPESFLKGCMTQQQKEEEVAVQAEGRQSDMQVNSGLHPGESPGQQVEPHQDERDRQSRKLHPLYSPGGATGWKTGPTTGSAALGAGVPRPQNRWDPRGLMYYALSPRGEAAAFLP